jgi:hypothetical protein
MKTFLIFVLTAALLAVACLTRPPESTFKDYLIQTRAALQITTKGSQATISKDAVPEEISHYLAGCTFADRLLWVDVKKDGRTVYTGIFSHWVAHQSEAIGAGK